MARHGPSRLVNQDQIKWPWTRLRIHAAMTPHMRCYLKRGGHIEANIPLTDGSDEALIEQGTAAFKKADRNHYDGFEVWRGDRCLYRWPSKLSESSLCRT